MSNKIWFREDGPAARFYKRLAPNERAVVDGILEDIRNNPEPDGVLRTSVVMPPAIICYYYDGHSRIAYNVSWSLLKDCCEIEILTIAS